MARNIACRRSSAACHLSARPTSSLGLSAAATGASKGHLRSAESIHAQSRPLTEKVESTTVLDSGRPGCSMCMPCNWASGEVRDWSADNTPDPLYRRNYRHPLWRLLAHTREEQSCGARINLAKAPWEYFNSARDMSVRLLSHRQTRLQVRTCRRPDGR